jgi:hypothetical protein
MDFHPDLHRDLMRQRIAEQRGEIERRRLARRSSGGPPLRARVARALFRAAFAVDHREVWRALWDQLAGGEPARRNVGG